MPASIQKIAKRHQRTQLEMLQDQTNRYQAIDTRESLRRAGRQTDKNLLADSLLNRASQLSAQKGVNKQSTLQARDLLKLNPDRGQSDR